MLKTKADGRLWSYCDSCGVCWEHPRDARLESGLNTLIDFRKQFLEEDVDFPTEEEVAAKELDPFVTRVAHDHEFTNVLAELNVRWRV